MESLGAVLLRLVISLSLVLGLMALAARFMRRRQGGVARTSRGGTAVQVLDRQQLTRNGGVAVVRVANKTLLLGVSDTAVRLLVELPAEAVVDAPPDWRQPVRADRSIAAPAALPAVLQALRERTVRR